MSKQSRIHLAAAQRNANKRRPMKPSPFKAIMDAAAQAVSAIKLPTIKPPADTDKDS